MSIFANVNGGIKELYRIFFNDNGVIREYESFHTQNDNNEIKELFVRDSNIPKTISWVTYDDGVSIINNVKNNGYTFNGCFTEHQRSVSTSDKIYLPANTQIKAKISNIIHETSPKPPFDQVDIYLFSDESTTPSQSEANSTSNILTVRTSGYYYIAFAIFWKDTGGNIHYATTDVDITIYPPK